MSGLEQRLRSLEGVADITVELGDEGLEGIRITVSDGSDESAVLDEVRRLLITYGLKSRREPGDQRLLPEFATAGGDRTEPTAGETAEAAPPSPDTDGAQDLATEWSDGDAPSDVKIVKTPEGLQVRLSGMGREIVEDGPGNADGAAAAMVRAVSHWRGREPPERVRVKIEEIEGEQIITLTVGTEGRVGAGAGVARPSMAAGLFRAAESALASRSDSAPA